MSDPICSLCGDVMVNLSTNVDDDQRNTELVQGVYYHFEQVHPEKAEWEIQDEIEKHIWDVSSSFVDRSLDRYGGSLDFESYAKEFGGGTGKFDWESEYFSIISVDWRGIKDTTELDQFARRVDDCTNRIIDDRHRLEGRPYQVQNLPVLDDLGEEDLRFAYQAEDKLDTLYDQVTDKLFNMMNQQNSGWWNNESYAKEDVAGVYSWWDGLSYEDDFVEIANKIGIDVEGKYAGNFGVPDFWDLDDEDKEKAMVWKMTHPLNESKAIEKWTDDELGSDYWEGGLSAQDRTAYDDDPQFGKVSHLSWNELPEQFKINLVQAIREDEYFTESKATEEDPVIEQVWQGFQNDGTIGDEKSDWELYAEYKLDEDEIEAKWNKEEGTESISIEDYEAPDYLIVDDEEDKGIIDAEDVGSEDPFNVKGLTDNPLFDFESFQKKHSMCKGCMQNSLEKLSRESQMADTMFQQGDFETYDEWENFALINGLSQQEAIDTWEKLNPSYGFESKAREDVELDVEEVWEDWLDGNHDTLYTENSWYGYAEKNGVSFMDALDAWANNSDELSYESQATEGYEDDIEDYKAEQNEDPSLYPEEIEALSPEELKRYQGKLGGDEFYFEALNQVWTDWMNTDDYGSRQEWIDYAMKEGVGEYLAISKWGEEMRAGNIPEDLSDDDDFMIYPTDKLLDKEFSKDMDELGKHAGYKHKDEDEEEQSKENITGYVVFDEDGNTVEREFSEDDAIHHATRIKGFVQPEEEGGYLGDVTFDARQPVYGQVEEQLTESQLLQKGNESYKVLENNSNIRFE